ncbi:hydrogenase expression protein [Sphingobacteriales bacterium UPWRP_1]|nr:hydrogenase expression protein [Sphingobacteriales bacterium UPWRP_1]
MHELSLVCGIIEAACEVMQSNDATQIEEIELEIGCLTGIEWQAFDLAWQTAIRNTPLAAAVCHITKKEGKAVCLECERTYSVTSLADACPFCRSYFKNVISGEELRIAALVVK